MTHQPAHQPPSRLGAWIAVVIGGLYFLLPLLATFEFSLKMLREGYSFAAYQAVLQDPGFQQSFAYSVLMALLTIVIGILLVAPTAFWIQLKLPRLRPLVEFITLLPLVIPAIVIVFGYLRLFGSDAWSLDRQRARHRSLAGLQLCDAGAALSVPFHRRRPVRHRCSFAGRGGAKPGRRLAGDPAAGDLPNIKSALLSGAFLTFAIVIGEFTMASLLARPAFGPYLQLIGANRAYEPAALAIIAFLITWAAMGLLQVAGRHRRALREAASH